MTGFQALLNNSIKNLRLSLEMTQEKFSEKCGLSTDNYRNLEYNRHAPKSSTIDKICTTFNLTPLELLRYGMEQSNDIHEITDLITGMSELQINIVKDFITLVRKYNIVSVENNRKCRYNNDEISR